MLEALQGGSWKRAGLWAGAMLLALLLPVSPLDGAESPRTAFPGIPGDSTQTPAPAPGAPATPPRVEVRPEADDAAIASRLERILNATGWFKEPTVRVEEGVVFLLGRTDSEQHKEWAGQIAAQTEAVVAVVNRIELSAEPLWDLTPAWNEIREMAAQAVRYSPLLLLAFGMLGVSWVVAGLVARGSRKLLHRWLGSDLLRTVAARAIAVLVFLLGLYLVLKISGLTRLAVTVLGGTGLIGLVIGFAFRDIAENFLASILMSMRRPFNPGDLVEVAGHQGYVQQLNTRATLLMTLDGNHVQIPNATIYKQIITNISSNPLLRLEFTVGIGYADSIAEAQSVAVAVMREHPAVLADPEPLALVDSLGPATVNLRLYFWIDLRQHSLLKVRSAVIRLTKRAFQQAGISMPDEQREVVFPEGIPIRMSPAAPDLAPLPQPPTPPRQPKAVPGDADSAHSGEGRLESEAPEIEHQARQSRSPEPGTNLLT